MRKPPSTSMRPLRIGVNALYLIPGAVGGTEIYLRHLLEALGEIDGANQYIVFTNRETGSGLLPAKPNFHARRQAVVAVHRPARISWEQIMLPLRVAAEQIDVLLNPGFTAPVLCGCPQVTVFHDLQHKRHPEHFRWFDLPFWRILLFWSAQLSLILIADSEATRADLERFYRLAPPRMRVVPLGVDRQFFAIKQARRPRKFLLTVSTLHPHKNIERLLRAFAEFRKSQPEFRLAVVGLRGFEAENLERVRDRLGLSETVEFTGWIPRDQLYDLYAQAWAFLYPSTFEGFGLPVLEALAAGVPTACARIEPLASTAGEAALQFDPGDDRALLDSVTRIVSDGELRRQLAVAGPRRAAMFSWATTARLTLDALESAVRSVDQLASP